MRLFVAIRLKDDLRLMLAGAARSLGETHSGVRLLKSENLHLTLKFLGEVAPDRISLATEVLDSIARDHRRFMVGISGSGCFPPAGPVRIIWAGCQDPSGTLGVVAERCEREFEALGFAREEKRFHAHITLARVRDDRGEVLRRSVETLRFIPLQQECRSISLFQSVQGKGGSNYVELHSSTLGD